MVLTEYAVEQKVAFLLTWGLLNFFWLALLAPAGDLGGAVARHDRRC